MASALATFPSRAATGSLIRSSPIRISTITRKMGTLYRTRRTTYDHMAAAHSCGAAAFQTVFHFHLHVIPRYEGDPLKLPWIPRGAEPGEIASVAAAIRERG
ncbi:MAG: HIT domain-containing protein [Acidobacteria bacterium]|nr:MAG: HIT domain-containing protein [Acidobacteriota bacterium]